MNVLQLDPLLILKVETTIPEDYNIIPSRITMRKLFLQYLDLNGIPNRNLLRAFKQFITNSKIKEKLDRILNPTDTRFYNDLVKDTSVGEFILEY